MGVRVSGPLCRDPHVLLDADAELDFDLVVVVDLDPLHQPGDDHPDKICMITAYRSYRLCVRPDFCGPA